MEVGRRKGGQWASGTREGPREGRKARRTCWGQVEMRRETVLGFDGVLRGLLSPLPGPGRKPHWLG